MAKSPKKRPQTHWFPADSKHPMLGARAYEKRLRPLQLLMRSISLTYFREGMRAVVVIEGTDTAGKGGAIRRLSAELDPRHYDVWPIGPPSPEELRHNYLWRFWQRLPEDGLIGIFDRSWYGRMLIERVDALAPEEDWRRAYDEIRAFEDTLIADGTRLVKIYLHVTAEEQRRRLAERVQDPHKRWKVSAADFESHLKRDAYIEAAREMFDRTSTKRAPWQVIAADDKHHARIAVLEAVTKALGKDVDLTPGPLDRETKKLAQRVVGDLLGKKG